MALYYRLATQRTIIAHYSVLTENSPMPCIKELPELAARINDGEATDGSIFANNGFRVFVVRVGIIII